MPRPKKDALLSLVKQYREVRFNPLTEADPLRYLEARRLEFIKRLELIADEARANGEPELELKAIAYGIRLTSIYKSRVDVTASNLGLLKPPDVSRLSEEELRKLEAGESVDVTPGKDPNRDLN